jgi:hypothetical protein
LCVRKRANSMYVGLGGFRSDCLPAVFFVMMGLSTLIN